MKTKRFLPLAALALLAVAAVASAFGFVDPHTAGLMLLANAPIAVDPAVIKEGLERIGKDFKAAGDQLVAKQRDLEARLLDLEQRQAKGLEPGSGGAGLSFGKAVEAEFGKNADLFNRTKQIQLTVPMNVKAITGAVTGSHSSLPVPDGPKLNPMRLAAVMSPPDIGMVQTLHYPRRTGVSGAAGVQDVEGAAKSASDPVYTAISQNQATIAGYCTTTEQALRSAGGLAMAIEAHLSRSVTNALDDLLIVGTTASGWPFAGLADLAQVYSPSSASLADAILAARLRMTTQGFTPSVVVLSEQAYLESVTARGSDQHYLNGPGLTGDLVSKLAGLQVCLSDGITDDEALLLDLNFAGYLAERSIRITMGVINDDFTKNLVRVRGEIDVIPFLSDFQAATIVRGPQS